MATVFFLAMIAVSLLLWRTARRLGRRRSDTPRRPGQSDGVRTVYRRGQ